MQPTGPLRGAVVLVLAVILVSVGAGAVAAGSPAQADAPPSSRTSSHTTDDGLSAVVQPIDANDVERAHGPSLSDLPVPLAPLIAGYSRYDGSCPLEHDLRQRIYDAIVEDPGTYPLALAETVGVSRSTVRYHVRILEREGLARTEKERGKRRVFSARSDECDTEPLVDDPAPRAVLSAIATHEPVSVSRLAETVDRSASTVSYHLGQLEDGGLIERERNGNTVLNMLSEDARVHLQSREGNAAAADGDGEAEGDVVESSVHAD